MLAALSADSPCSHGAPPQGPEPPAQAALFDDFDDSEGYPTAEALRSLLSNLPGERAEVGRANKWERPICRISGLFRLIAPWPPGSALRFSVLDPERLQVHVWSGAQGVTVRYYPEHHQTWALYSTTREGAKPRPAKHVLAATAGDRYRRAGFGSVQLQHQGGSLVLLRGDLVLGSVPLAAPPSEVFIEGSGLVRGLAVVPSQWLPAPPRRDSASWGKLRPAPATLRVIRPADWTWESNLPKGIALGKLPDGRVVLTASEKTPQGQAAIAIQNPGFSEFIFDVEDPEPGTGLFLGDAQGRHICRLGFLRHRESGQTAFELLPSHSSESEKPYDIQRQVVPLAGRRQWYRIVAGAGLFTCWTSADGLSWSQVGPTSVEGEGVCGQVGLYCFASDKKRSITLRSLEVRRLEALHAAAPAELQKQVGNLAKFDSLEKWEDEVARSAPGGVPADLWWRACAVKTLGDGPKASLARPLWDRLQRAVYASAADADACLRFAEEASMFYAQGDWASMDRLMTQFQPLGMALVRLKHPAPFSALHRSMLTWPLRHVRRLPAYPDELLRCELVARIGEARWGEVQDLCRRLEYFNRTGGPREGEQPPWSPHAEYLVQWAEAVARAKEICQQDREKVLELGGLHILGTDRHEARRIDNQLRGRSGRQGDPGSSRFYVSLEDELMRRFGGERVKGFMEWAGMDEDIPIEHDLVTKSLENAQVRVEGYNFDIRKHLLEYDDVVNKQREIIYEQRHQVLSEENLRPIIVDMIQEEVASLVATHTAGDTEDWDLEGLQASLRTIMLLPPSLTPARWEKLTPKEIEEQLLELAERLYEEKERHLGAKDMRQLERLVMLRAVDSLWIRHLTGLDDLREGIGLRAYGQQDPLVAFKKEAHEMYADLLAAIQHAIVGDIYRVSLVREPQPRPMREMRTSVEAERAPQPVRTAGAKVGRNDPCPCGSGKKYKHCCMGKEQAPAPSGEKSSRSRSRRRRRR